MAIGGSWSLAHANMAAANGRKLFALRIALALLLVLGVVSIFRSAPSALDPPFGSGDFGMTVKAAEDLQHENPYNRYLKKGPGPWSAETPDANGNPMGLYPVQVPSVLMLLWPFTPLGWPAAKLTWFVLNLIFSVGCGLLLARRLSHPALPEVGALLAGILLVSLPWRIAIANGQHLIAGMFFFLLSAELADGGRKNWAGAALAFSFIKYTATLFLLPYFVWKRQWRPIVVALGIHAALTLGVAIWLDESPISLVMQAAHAALSYQPDPGVYQLSDGFIDMFAVSRSLGLPLAIPFAAAVAGTTVSYWLAIRRRGSEAMFLSLLCFWAYVAMYHRAYDAVILLIPLACALKAVRFQPMPWVLVLAVIACLWFLDRLVIQSTDWLVPGEHGRQSIYYATTVSLYYATLFALASRQVRAAYSDDETYE